MISDVENPLIGSNGAAKIFAKQKGANEYTINLLEKGMQNFSELVRRYFNLEISDMKAAGAAGGLGAGALVFLNAKL